MSEIHIEYVTVPTFLYVYDCIHFRDKVCVLSHLMVLDLSLKFLYVTGGDGSVLDDTMGFLYQSLEVLYFLFILLILHHSLLQIV